MPLSRNSSRVVVISLLALSIIVCGAAHSQAGPVASIANMKSGECMPRDAMLSALGAASQYILLAGEMPVKDPTTGESIIQKFAITADKEFRLGYKIYSFPGDKLCRGDELNNINLFDTAAGISSDRPDGKVMLRAKEAVGPDVFLVKGRLGADHKPGEGTFMSFNSAGKISSARRLDNLRYTDVALATLEATRKTREKSHRFSEGACYARSDVIGYATVVAGGEAPPEGVRGLPPKGTSWSDTLSKTDPSQKGPVGSWTLGRIRDDIDLNFDDVYLEKSVAEYAAGAKLSLESARRDKINTRKYEIAALQKAGVTLLRSITFSDAAFNFVFMSKDGMDIDPVRTYCAVEVKLK